MKQISILYITRIFFSSQRAHVHTISKTAEALGKIKDINFALVSTDNSVNDQVALENYYAAHSIVSPFKIYTLNSWSNHLKKYSSRLAYYFGLIFDNFTLCAFLWKMRKTTDVIYVRDHQLFGVVAFAYYILRKKIYFEAHFILTNSFGQKITEYIVRRSKGVVAIAGALKDYYTKICPEVIVSYCAAAEQEAFSGEHDCVKTEKKSLRAKLDLPLDKTILCYTGNIGKTGTGHSYGVEDIIKALPLLSDKFFFVVVGKKPTDSNELENLAKELKVSSKVIFVPWQSRSKIPNYILAADILVIPKSGAQPGNSPTKAFEYLASGRPIVAAKTIPISEVLVDETTALLVDYENPQAWADSLNKVMTDATLSEKLVSQAKRESLKYSWENRAKDISDFIKNTFNKNPE